MEFELRISQALVAWTHLWCVFLTHGNALKIETATAMVVKTPITRTTGWLTLWSAKIKIILNINHMKPEVAHPE